MSQRPGGDLQAEPSVPRSWLEGKGGDTGPPLASSVPKEQADEDPQIREWLRIPQVFLPLASKGVEMDQDDNLGMPTRPPDSLT